MKKIILIFTIFLLLNTINVVSLEIKSNDSTDSLPSYFNYRDMNGIDFTTPIKNQAPAPTCETYGLCAALETIMQYQTDELFEPDLSECHLYFYAGGTYEAGYVNLMDAADYLIEYGVPDEGCYPDPHRPFDYPYESVEGWEERTVKIQDWGWVDHSNEAIKSALIEYGPLVFCMSLYKDFMYYWRGVYEHRWGDRVGGHVLTIVGYDDSNNCWIVKNSWGDNWGEKGWFRLSYDEDLIAEWYGPGTGIMYLDGVYGNFQPDVPKIYIEKPDIYHFYFFGIQLPIFLKKLDIQSGSPRIFGKMKTKLNVDNADKVEFYIDDELVFSDDEEPFEWILDVPQGLHTFETIAYKGQNISKDMRDIFFFI